MSTDLLALDPAVSDDSFVDAAHRIHHAAFQTDRLDPVRLAAATRLPVRSSRLLAPQPRQFTVRSCDDGNQVVHVVEADAALYIEFDLPAGSRYRVTAERPEGLMVNHEPAVIGAVVDLPMGGPLRIASRGRFELAIVTRHPAQHADDKPPAGMVPLSTEGDGPQQVRRLLDQARLLWTTTPSPARRPASSSHVLDVVEQVLGQQPYGVLHPSDFATPAGISVRSLERAMQKAYGMGPKRWITATRLNTAHQHLSRPGADDRTVAQIARRCGFQHAGRFSQAYRALFGDYPHDVLVPSAPAAGSDRSA